MKWHPHCVKLVGATLALVVEKNDATEFLCKKKLPLDSDLFE